VLEQGHTLILGWNDRILSLVQQLCEANISENGLPIVILSSESKVTMDDFFMDALPPEDRHGSKIVTRSGSRIECSQLLKVAVSYARSIVVLSEGSDPDEADAQSVRAVLALTGGLAALGKAPTCHMVLEIQDVDNADVAMLGVVPPMDPEKSVVPVVSHDIIGKLMVQCSREIGLSNCFNSLLCFAGSECYFQSFNNGEGLYDDGMVGKSFQDACYRFKDAAVLGVRFANPNDPKVRLAGNAQGRPVMLNPSGDYVMQYGDRILVLAEDNDTFSYGASNSPNSTPTPGFELPPPEPEKFLLCGWRRDFDDLITELDKWVPENSLLTLLNGYPEEKMKRLLADGGMAPLKNIRTIEYVTGDPCRAKCIMTLGPKDPSIDDPLTEPDDRWSPNSFYRIEEYDSILMLSEEGRDSGMSADSRVMVSMLVMRHIQLMRKVVKGILVTEIRDPRTVDLMALTKCSDKVVGNELVAMILAQISEDRDIGYVMEDLFAEEGMEMHVKDIRTMVAPDELVTWWDLVSRCISQNMLPLGWIRKNGNPDIWDCVLNPADKDSSLRWHGDDYPNGDLLVVISEN